MQLKYQFIKKDLQSAINLLAVDSKGIWQLANREKDHFSALMHMEQLNFHFLNLIINQRLLGYTRCLLCRDMNIM